MSNFKTRYLNTDFDLRSRFSFEHLKSELEKSCCLLHYCERDEGGWTACVESDHEDDSCNRTAAMDIRAIIQELKSLSTIAKTELDQCHLREFNIGFDCGETWSYVHQIPADVVAEVAEFGCSIAVTFYPIRAGDSHIEQIAVE